MREILGFVLTGIDPATGEKCRFSTEGFELRVGLAFAGLLAAYPVVAVVIEVLAACSRRLSQ